MKQKCTHLDSLLLLYVHSIKKQKNKKHQNQNKKTKAKESGCDGYTEHPSPKSHAIGVIVDYTPKIMSILTFQTKIYTFGSIIVAVRAVHWKIKNEKTRKKTKKTTKNKRKSYCGCDWCAGPPLPKSRVIGVVID